MRLAKIIPNDVVNGQGVCVSVFVQGCPHHCHGCFNPETWSFEAGTAISNDEMAQKILDLISANGLTRNLSWLGGEPLAPQNRGDVWYITKQVIEKYPDIQIWIWTGYVYEELIAMRSPAIENLLHKVHGVLIDGPFLESEKDLTLPFRGSRNQRLIQLPITHFPAIEKNEKLLYNYNIDN